MNLIIFIFIFYFVCSCFILKNKFDKMYIKSKPPDWYDVNYLGHDFSDTTLYECDMRKCNKCGVKAYSHCYGPRAGKCNTFDAAQISGETYPILILSCNEMIIKKLLE